MTEAEKRPATKSAKKVYYQRKPGPKRKRGKPCPVRGVERIKGHPDFINDWGFPQDNAKVSHFFTAAAAGNVISLCHVYRQRPVWVIPATDKDEKKCGMCLRVLERRQRLATLRQEKKLKRSLDGRIASFLDNQPSAPGCTAARSAIPPTKAWRRRCFPVQKAAIPLPWSSNWPVRIPGQRTNRLKIGYRAIKKPKRNKDGRR